MQKHLRQNISKSNRAIYQQKKEQNYHAKMWVSPILEDHLDI